jgi:hypothetical protein
VAEQNTSDTSVQAVAAVKTFLLLLKIFLLVARRYVKKKCSKELRKKSLLEQDNLRDVTSIRYDRH